MVSLEDDIYFYLAQYLEDQGDSRSVEEVYQIHVKKDVIEIVALSSSDSVPDVEELEDIEDEKIIKKRKMYVEQNTQTIVSVLSTEQINDLAGVTGALVYDADKKKLMVFDGTDWV